MSACNETKRLAGVERRDTHPPNPTAPNGPLAATRLPAIAPWLGRFVERVGFLAFLKNYHVAKTQSKAGGSRGPRTHTQPVSDRRLYWAVLRAFLRFSLLWHAHCNVAVPTARSQFCSERIRGQCISGLSCCALANGIAKTHSTVVELATTTLHLCIWVYFSQNCALPHCNPCHLWFGFWLLASSWVAGDVRFAPNGLDFAPCAVSHSLASLGPMG